MNNIVLLTAGGRGKRMGRSVPKQFVEVNGKPIIIHTLEVFEKLPEINGIVISCIEEWVSELQKYIKKYGISKVVSVIAGGNTGQDSIYNGLVEIRRKYDDDTFVLIHDSVRPLVLPDTIEKNIQKAHESDSSVTCVPLTETVITGNNGKFCSVNRDESLMARAPQTFKLGQLIEVHEMARKEGLHNFVDTCTMMLHYRRKVSIIIGSPENIKITTPSDIFAFKSFLQKRESEYFLNQK